MPNTTHDQFRSAFVAFIGRPNSGKSTLLNTLIDERLSIVSPLPQTTRRNMKGIFNEPGLQLVFVDSPGIHAGNHLFNKSMFSQGMNLISDESIDILCYLIDLARASGDEEDLIAKAVAKCTVPKLIVFNKTDVCESTEDSVAAFYERYPGLTEIPSIQVSAISKDARECFLDALRPMVPGGPRYFPEDDLTDADLRFFAAEYIREQIINETREEVPHAAFVEILSYREEEAQHVIDADIHVETKGQRGILIGEKGNMIRQIQRNAEKTLKKLVDMPVHISCHIRVTPKWRDNRRFLSEMDMPL